ncbi:MAG TPA: hypothetical protein VE758_04950, partial [Chthoniobacterales bacterium]|nr:hypothetical protein [Chthoniobacterales bacterium]
IFPGVVEPAKAPLDIPAVLFDPAGSFAGVSSPYINGGRQRANGVDLGLQYQLETQYGTWTFLSRWSYLNEFVFSFPGTRPRQVAGRANYDWWAGSFFGDVTNGDGWMKWKGATTVDWTWKNWDLNFTLNMKDGWWEEIYATQFDGFWKQHWVSPTWFVDAQLSYTMVFTPPVEQQPVAGYSKGGKEVMTSKEGGKKQVESAAAYSMPCWQTILNNTTFTIGSTDLFGEDPPHAFGFELGNSVGFPGEIYDNFGHFYYAKLTKKF